MATYVTAAEYDLDLDLCSLMLTVLLCLWLRIYSVFFRDVTISALRLYVFLDLQLPYDAAQQCIPESPTAVDIFKSWSKAHFFSLAFKSNRDQYGIIILALTFCVVLYCPLCVY